MGGYVTGPCLHPPAIFGIVEIGQSFAIVPGTAGNRYSLYRNGVLVGGASSDITLAQVPAYVMVAADCANTQETWEEHPAGAPGTGLQSNALFYYPSSRFRDVYDPAVGATVAAGVITALASQGPGGNNMVGIGSPVYNVSDAGFNNQPSITFDGALQAMNAPAYAAGGAFTQASLFFVARAETAGAGDVTASYAETGSIYLRVRKAGAGAAQRWQETTNPGAANALMTTNVGVGNRALIGGTWNGGTPQQRVFYGATAEATVASGMASLATGGDLTMAGTWNAGAPALTANDTVALMVFGPTVVSANAIASLAAYCTARFGTP